MGGPAAPAAARAATLVPDPPPPWVVPPPALLCHASLPGPPGPAVLTPPPLLRPPALQATCSASSPPCASAVRTPTSWWTSWTRGWSGCEGRAAAQGGGQRPRGARCEAWPGASSGRRALQLRPQPLTTNWTPVTVGMRRLLAHISACLLYTAQGCTHVHPSTTRRGGPVMHAWAIHPGMH